MVSDSFRDFSPERYFSARETRLLDHISDSVPEMENVRAELPVQVMDDRSQRFVDSIVNSINDLPWQVPTLLACEGFQIAVGRTLPSMFDQICSWQEVAKNADSIDRISRMHTTVMRSGHPDLDKKIFIASHRESGSHEWTEMTPSDVAPQISGAMAHGVLKAFTTPALERTFIDAFRADMANEENRLAFSRQFGTTHESAAIRTVGEDILTSLWGAPKRNGVDVALMLPTLSRVAGQELGELWRDTIENLSLAAALSHGSRGELSAIPATLRVSRLRHVGDVLPEKVIGEVESYRGVLDGQPAQTTADLTSIPVFERTSKSSEQWWGDDVSPPRPEDPTSIPVFQRTSKPS